MMSDYIQISLTRSGSAGSYTYSWQNIPLPKLDSGTLEYATNVDGGRNASGRFIGQTIGSDKMKLNLAFPPLTDTEFHDFLSLFDRAQGGKFTFYVKFYDPRTQAKVIKQMYVGDRSGDPFRVGTTSTGVPSHWLNVKANLVEV
jgi:hypothetical protein